MASKVVWVCGEVLIDLLPGARKGAARTPVVGGGSANTAKALVRLGLPAQFIDGLSQDEYGQMARADLARDGVGLGLCLDSPKRTCLAIVSVDDKGAASYEFVIEDTATFAFDASWLPSPHAGNPAVLYIGSLATVIEPGASSLLAWASTVAQTSAIVFDPNVRPAVVPHHDAYVRDVERWLPLASIIKASDDDIKWLYPGEELESVARRWLTSGACLVVITRGAGGLLGVTDADTVTVPSVPVVVVDTVGAGDTVGAVLVEALVRGPLTLPAHGGRMRDAPTRAVLEAVLRRAAKAAAITCSRAGAQPPTLDDLNASPEP